MINCRWVYQNACKALKKIIKLLTAEQVCRCGDFFERFILFLISYSLTRIEISLYLIKFVLLESVNILIKLLNFIKTWASEILARKSRYTA